MKMVLDYLKSIPTHMDFDGQRRAERLFQTVIITCAAIGLVIGYITQHFSHTVYILAAGFVLSCVLTLPPWPMYRRKPLPWLKPRDEMQEGAGNTVHKVARKKK